MLNLMSLLNPAAQAEPEPDSAPQAPEAEPEPIPFDPDIFAIAWYSSWNSHDLDSILSHYSDEVVFESPFVQKLANETGVIHGKNDLRAYFDRALAANPTLHFEPLIVFAGVNSITLMYRSVQNLLAAETMEIDAKGQVQRVMAHYTPEK